MTTIMNYIINWAGILLITGGQVFAVMGVGDVVIVASNPAQELLWASKELPKWIEMIDKAKQQVDRAQETIDVIGHPEKFVGKLVESSAPIFAATKAIHEMKSSAEVLDFTEKSWALFKGGRKLGKTTLEVAHTYEVFGQTMSRDTKRYLRMAKEKALRGHLEELLTKKHDVDGQELEFQKKTLAEFSTTATQAQIALHQAGLAASKQRMDILASRVNEAESELQTYLADTELELRKVGTELQEQAEASLDEMRKRANRAVQRAGSSI